MLLPPFSVLAVVSCAIAGVQALLPTLRLLLPPAVSFGFVAAWALFPVMGLLVDPAPLSTYRALVYGPFYIAWRLAIGVRARVLGNRVRWARTTRREDTASPE